MKLLSAYEKLGKLPFYKLVPKTLEANLTFRETILNDAAGDRDYQDELWMMCARDILFYFNAFLWTYDPRRSPNELPFITYPFQDEAICCIDHAIEHGYHLNIKKTRDVGASWIVLGTTRHREKFRWRESFMLLSRKEDLVDKTGNSDSLMWKLDFMQELEPPWMQEASERASMHHRNLESYGCIDGESTNNDCGRGGRRKAIPWDEASACANGFDIIAAIANNTDCVLRVYTPRGTATEAFDSEKHNKVIKIHWLDHPRHRRGLYRVLDGGKVEILDEAYYAKRKKPYKFITKVGPCVHVGQLRSPWYDKKCKDLHWLPALVASELDLNDQGSESQFFDAAFLEEAKKHCTPPDLRGELDFDRDTCEPRQFLDRPQGLIQLWCLLPNGRPVDGRTYTVGFDIAAGTGASNSTFAVTDDQTGEKVAAYANPAIMPHEFAKLGVAVAKFFHNALMIWEANGPGRIFGNVVIELGYREIYFDLNERQLVPSPDDVPGWTPTKEKKVSMLGDYRAAQMDGKYLDRDHDCLVEQGSYVFLPNQAVAHSSSSRNIDPSGANDNHGDRVIATALSYRGSKARRKKHEKKPASYPKGSHGWRMQQARKSRENKSYWRR